MLPIDCEVVSETGLNFRLPLSGLMGAGLVARISKPRRGRGYFFVARLERETVSVAVLADIGMAAVSQGEVGDKAAHQCSRRARERYMPRMMLPTTRISKFKHLSVLP